MRNLAPPHPLHCGVPFLQDGTAGVDSFRAAAVDQEDGSVVLAGTSSSNVTDDLDFFVGKLDAEGTVLWRFQVKQKLFSCAPTSPKLGSCSGNIGSRFAKSWHRA